MFINTFDTIVTEMLRLCRTSLSTSILLATGILLSKSNFYDIDRGNIILLNKRSVYG